MPSKSRKTYAAGTERNWMEVVEMSYCKNCGAQISTRYCPWCGTDQQEDLPDPSQTGFDPSFSSQAGNIPTVPVQGWNGSSEINRQNQKGAPTEILSPLPGQQGYYGQQADYRSDASSQYENPARQSGCFSGQNQSRSGTSNRPSYNPYSSSNPSNSSSQLLGSSIGQQSATGIQNNNGSWSSPSSASRSQSSYGGSSNGSYSARSSLSSSDRTHASQRTIPIPDRSSASSTRSEKITGSDALFSDQYQGDYSMDDFIDEPRRPVEQLAVVTAESVVTDSDKHSAWVKLAIVGGCLLLVLLLFTGGFGPCLVSEECDYCGRSPSYAYEVSTGYSYVCDHCRQTCMWCGRRKATKHWENGLHMMIFLCDRCADPLH